MTIDEGNKIIALSPYSKMRTYQVASGYSKMDIHNEVTIRWFIDLEYHKSWNQIISVVKKLMPALEKSIEYPDNGEPCEASDRANIALGRIIGALLDLNIEELWKETVNGIKALEQQI